MSEPISHNSPVPSIMRLPVYLRYLKEVRASGETVISCTRIADEFNQLSVQVRKDLAITGITGRPKVGYQIGDLIDAIESFLGWDKETTAFLVGAGNLGNAILGYQGFVEHGLRILAAFDTDRAKIGTTIHGCPVYSTHELAERGTEARVDIGILTVPASGAQRVADQLTAIGVKGIWNYTPCRLTLPDDVICEEVRLSACFAVLSNRLLNRSETEARPK